MIVLKSWNVNYYDVRFQSRSSKLPVLAFTLYRESNFYSILEHKYSAGSVKYVHFSEHRGHYY